MEQIDIKSLRTAMGLSREDFAALFPVDPATVWRWETSDTTPTPIVQRRLVELAASAKKMAAP